jgi:hypothetical protein
LTSSISVEFSNAIWITHSHDIEYTIKSRANTFAIFIPDLEKFLTLAVHYHTTAISKNTLNKKIFIQERDLLYHVT